MRILFIITSLTLITLISKNNIMSNIQNIPERQGDRPVTGDALPHLQFSDNSSKDIHDSLASWLFNLKYIEERSTIISVRGARAAWIYDNYLNVNNEVLQVGREFTHIHPSTGNDHGGSLHLTLNREDCETVISKSWGEYHPMDYIAFPEKKYGHILIYAPRTMDELKTVKTIIETSYKLVTNQK